MKRQTLKEEIERIKSLNSRIIEQKYEEDPYSSVLSKYDDNKEFRYDMDQQPDYREDYDDYEDQSEPWEDIKDDSLLSIEDTNNIQDKLNMGELEIWEVDRKIITSMLTDKVISYRRFKNSSKTGKGGWGEFENGTFGFNFDFKRERDGQNYKIIMDKVKTLSSNPDMFNKYLNNIMKYSKSVKIRSNSFDSDDKVKNPLFAYRNNGKYNSLDDIRPGASYGM